MSPGNGGHQWSEPGDFTHVADFILRNFGLPEFGSSLEKLPLPFFPATADSERPPYPEGTIDLGELATRLTGVSHGKPESLLEVFPKPGFLTDVEFESLDLDAREYFTQVASFL